MNEKDKRVIRTRGKILQAFAQLVSQKNINNITIKDIAETAGINRKTFYNHYDGIYQIMDELENEVVSTFGEIIESVEVESLAENIAMICSKLTVVLNEDYEFYRCLMKTENNSKLVIKITSSLKTRMKSHVQSYSDINPEVMDVVIEYILSGMMAVYREWFSASEKCPVEQVTELIGRLTMAVVNCVVDNKSESVVWISGK